MAQRNQIRSFFAGHDPGHARDTQHIAFLVIAQANTRQCFRLHMNPTLGDGDTLGVLFGADIDHMGLTGGVEMREFGHGWGFRRRLSGVVNLGNRIIESRSDDRKSSMAIHVRFFASLRERLDVADQDIAASAASTVAEVWQRIVGDTEPPANMLVAVNMEYADMQAPVRDGDEVAFFPPVTGG